MPVEFVIEEGAFLIRPILALDFALASESVGDELALDDVEVGRNLAAPSCERAISEVPFKNIPRSIDDDSFVFFGLVVRVAS